jgi:sensor histidine kinase YesM
LIEWARLTWWWRRRPPPLQLWVVTALAIVLGYLGGGAVASALTHADRTVLLQFGPWGFLVGAVTLATSVFALHFVMQRELLSEERRQADSARLQLLQQQIEPHMLFNTIANVHALIDEKPADAQRMLEALGELLHASMQLNEQPLVSLKQEFALLRHYLQLMSIRMGPRLAYSVVLPPELEEARVPPLSVQPLVENAVKHGLEPSVSGGTVHISARTEGHALIIEVVDSGLGLEIPAPAESGSIGLSNVRKRLAYAFGERASLQLRKNQPHGVIASLTIPR